MDDMNNDLLRQVAGHTERFRLLQNANKQFNIDARLRDSKRFLTAKCCGKVFTTKEAKTKHENVSFMQATRRYCEK